MFYPVDLFPTDLISKLHRIVRAEVYTVSLVFNRDTQSFSWEMLPAGAYRQRSAAFTFRLFLKTANCSQNYDAAFEQVQQASDFEQLVNNINFAHRDFQLLKKLQSKLARLLISALESKREFQVI